MGIFGRKVRIKTYMIERQLKRNVKSQARRCSRTPRWS
jgi:hypothetical protein